MYNHHELGKLQKCDNLVSDNENSVNNFEIEEKNYLVENIA